MKNIVLILTSFLLFLTVNAQKDNNYIKDYIDTFKEIAIEEMNRTGIPASITLAQGILESGWGKSRLATVGNNHFGIKCHKGWTGSSMTHDDDAIGECFRTYDNAEQSYRDHSDFLTGRSRYAFIFKYKKADYESWAKGLKKAGYATNPKYAELLIDKIKRYHLNIYDKKDWKKRERALAYNKMLSTGDVVFNYKSPNTRVDYQTITASSETINKPTENYYQSSSINATNPTIVRNNTTQPASRYNKPRIKPVVEIRKARNKPQDKILTNVEINKAFEAGGSVIKKKGIYNKLKYAQLKYPASPFRAAQALKVDQKNLEKWNEVTENYKFPAGGKIYFQKKRTKPVKGVTTHTVKQGETMLSISNMYGVKVLALYLRNKIKPPSENSFPEPLEVGKILNIKKATSF